MLQSPFPGMDPYLEINPRWQVFHGWFVAVNHRGAFSGRLAL